MVFKDYYKILNLPDITANQQVIREAYKKQAKNFHPDITNKNTEEIFNDICEAYNVLSDKSKKQKYDRLWLNYIGRNKHGNKTYEHRRRTLTVKEELKNLFLGNFLNSITGKNKSTKKRKELDIYSSIDITLDEGFFGSSKTIVIKQKDGTTKKIVVKLPKGITNGESIRLKNLGNTSKNNEYVGDLYLAVNIIDQEDLYLKDLNIYKTIYLYPWDYILGTTLTLNILNEDLSLIIPRKTSPYELFILKNKGYRNTRNRRGDLIINTKIVIPNTYTEKQVELFKELRNLHNENIELGKKIVDSFIDIDEIINKDIENAINKLEDNQISIDDLNLDNNTVENNDEKITNSKDTIKINESENTELEKDTKEPEIVINPKE